MRSAWPISSAASGVAKPPETSRYQGSPTNSPFAAADTASSAPHRSASPVSAARDCRGARVAPRPAMNTGRRADNSASINAETSGATGSVTASATDESATAARRPARCDPAGAACTSSGQAEHDGGRRRVRRPAGGRHVRAVRSGRHPTYGSRRSTGHAARGRCRSWTPAGSPRAPGRPSGCGLLAASVIPVNALVTPGPWWTVSTANRPDTRA